MVDTGATVVVMSHRDARRAGIMVAPSDYTGRARTANGIARVPMVIAEGATFGLAYDPVRQRTVLFGGASGTLLDDTWEFDGQDWAQIATANAPRFENA